MYKSFIKRYIDIALSIVGLLILFIPMIIVAILIKFDSDGPALFRQVRLGKNQKEFTIYKFRTMCNHAYEIGGVANSSNDYRITKIGAILRRTSFDEFPQLINILKGDMSIIGPRPILPEEFEEYRKNELYCRRYDILPGMFCTVDIEYRASSDRDLQFSMDVDYVNNVSFKEDCRTFFSIILPVVTGKNVYKNN